MKTALTALALIALTVAPAASWAQDVDTSSPQSTSENAAGATTAGSDSAQQKQAPAAEAPPASIENTLTAGEDEEPIRQLVRWNEYKGPYLTVRVGGGFLFEGAAFSQDTQSKEQFRLTPGAKVRDARLLFKGSLFPKFTNRLSWTAGVMYDGLSSSWLVRETGIMIAVPEAWGKLFIGRTKEGFSLNKVMVGYAGWTMERSTMSDATIPILADGIKWLGYSPKHGFLWNLGLYHDYTSQGQSFSTYSSQYVARIAWLPIHSEKGKLFHLGVNLRYGKPEDGQLRLRSRPEAFPAPYFVDTGQFPASTTRMAGYEVYYRPHNWLFGSEYWFMKVTSPSRGNPTFQGGDAVATWLITGETRPYNTIGGFFREIVPARPVFSGGPGAWELVFRYSYTDLDSRGVQGGRFARFTPMVNWYLSDSVRLEFAYGYGHLDRFDLKGNTQFFQSRVQFWF
jgi:phosphate-selective porin OprO/OprP